MYNEIIILGVVLSLLFSELTSLSPAGLVVPGYIALSLQYPIRVVYTFAIVLLTYWVVKLLSRHVILYGRRQFALMILISFLLGRGIALILPYDPGIIGYLVPGIMGNQMLRQGVWKTFVSLFIVTGLIALCMFLAGVPVF